MHRWFQFLSLWFCNLNVYNIFKTSTHKICNHCRYVKNSQWLITLVAQWGSCHDPYVNNALRDARAPEPPPWRHHDGGGVPVTIQQPMHDGSPATGSNSGSTSSHTNDVTATHQTGRVMHSLPNAVGNALATILEAAYGTISPYKLYYIIWNLTILPELS